MTLSRLGEAWADPTFHNIHLSYVEVKRVGVDWKGGGGGSDKIM